MGWIQGRRNFFGTGLEARGGSGGQEGGWVVWGDWLGAEDDEVGGCLNCDLGGI